MLNCFIPVISPSMVLVLPVMYH